MKLPLEELKHFKIIILFSKTGYGPLISIYNRIIVIELDKVINYLNYLLFFVFVLCYRQTKSHPGDLIDHMPMMSNVVPVLFFNLSFSFCFGNVLS